jgi:predicted outer membrane repeat protein
MMKKTNTLFFTLIFSWLLVSQATAQATVIFVANGASGNNDGSSWADAFNSLQGALAAAAEADTIWVKAGIYAPGGPGDDSTATFLLSKNVALFGGFAGTETELAGRDPAAYVTILSGDLNGDDIPGDLDSNRTGNALTVMTVAGSLTGATIIDGFTIAGGHAVGGDSEFYFRRGGGMFLFGAPTVSNCIFTENYADAEGGALYFQGPFAEGTQIENCVFENNRAGGDGGAFMASYCPGEGIFINDCDFSNNYAREQGGAVKLFNTTCHFDQTSFSGNAARKAGGAIDSRGSFDDVLVVATDCIFEQNRSRSGAALRFNPQGILSVYNNSLQISGCTFEQNEAMLIDNTVNGTAQGGALHLILSQGSNDATATIENCVFTQNTAARNGSAIRAEVDGQDFGLNLTGCAFEGNSVGNRGAVYISSAKLAKGTVGIDDCAWDDNTSEAEAAGLALQTRDGADIQYSLTTCRFSNNSALTSGGAMVTYCLGFSAMNLWADDCDFDGNSAAMAGGAVFATIGNDGFDAAFSHCYFTGNGSAGGAAFSLTSTVGQTEIAGFLSIDNSLIVENTSGDAVISADSFPGLSLLNCTVANNQAGSLVLDSASSAHLENNIFFNPGYPEFSGVSDEISSQGGNVVGDGSLDAVLSALDKSNADPLFAGAGDYQLISGSPAIGHGVAPDDPPAFDLAGNDRVQGGKIDAGAFESPFVSALSPQLSQNGFISFAPNPAGAVGSLRLENVWRGKITLRLLDAAGQEVKTFKLEKQTHAATWEMKLEGLPAGAYILSLASGNNAIQTVIVKKED